MFDIAGMRFGKLRAIAFSHIEKGDKPRHMWRCICDCGKTTYARKENLRSKNTKSCGCGKYGGAITHGYSRYANVENRRLYVAWSMMLDRCKNPRNKAYKYYGASGVSVCKRWCKFENFLADMGHRPSPKHTLDRIDPYGNYKPSNCRWATWTEQRNNRRSQVTL